ncbi:hypothetical protein L1987_30013 [Smallanthus sonchifolius]|uniref:Uncharacterized protein n=1 Tax=Smallanthus sonchifolius TaxID=185202 RepID=A0ACB9I361_9ASTR|nr:hypothetical protein L1987_30013 [Smallanthus sonchifolius]
MVLIVGNSLQLGGSGVFEIYTSLPSNVVAAMRPLKTERDTSRVKAVHPAANPIHGIANGVELQIQIGGWKEMISFTVAPLGDFKTSVPTLSALQLVKGVKKGEETFMNIGAFDQDVLASPVWALARIGTVGFRLNLIAYLSGANTIKEKV